MRTIIEWPVAETDEHDPGPAGGGATSDLGSVVGVAVSNAYSKGGIPLTVAGVANLEVAGHQPPLNNALERLLGKVPPQIIQVAKDTLEGNLRGVLSQLTPEEVDQDELRFVEKLLEEAEHDLSRLGLTLDVLKIQNVADDVGYLNSLGRKQSAGSGRRRRRRRRGAESQRGPCPPQDGGWHGPGA